MKSGGKSGQEELKICQECLQEGFWYRAVPLVAFTVGGTLYSARRGWLKPSTRFGIWPKVIMPSALMLGLGPLSYLSSSSCKKKFLERTPNGSIALTIKSRELPEPAAEDVKPIDEYDNTIRIPGFDQNGKEMPPLSPDEVKIFKECNRVATVYFNLPSMLVFGTLGFVGQIKGYLKESTFFTSPRFARLPKTFAGLVVGYTLGQLSYAASGHCSNLFLRDYPYTNIAKFFRRQEYFAAHGRFPGETVHTPVTTESGETIVVRDPMNPNSTPYSTVDDIPLQDVVPRSYDEFRQSSLERIQADQK
ncbi:hypothetical protein TCAL_00760 [Tigriopus californicus]|uniref:OCIA domain-containing protein n=1 Tax=Tigriopus californicus TaxID=6832 RepID=A0A553PCE9_TIGCA|nr:uncharacterized protein LOC131877076 [Tigriopus californicus]TRY75365.1 hypothetical protein TCAL_00760 [Tigriopus californicus]|eukprot:TCALIF_00760-PA protein Name:"Similar to ociad1 OCIA domain-containing protein 1 (Danio rerio)" AED:0.29 eAED:0.31 QI:0/-1/0/1/-1/1/1/0/304